MNMRTLFWVFFSLFLANMGLTQTGPVTAAKVTTSPCQSKENNHWRFGLQVGLDFNSDSPVQVWSSMKAFENSAVISDQNGDLMFYTNGGQVSSSTQYPGGIWNRNDQLMPNGALGFNDIGCTSSSTSALIVPDPGDSSEYYVFVTSCAEEGFQPGLAYHKVDMDLDNGLGDVTQKNQFVTYLHNENIAGVRHCNGRDYWMAAGTDWPNTIRIYLIDSTGIDTTPVFIQPVDSTIRPRRLKFSPDGHHLAAIFYSIQTGGSITHIYDFDPTQGTLTFNTALPTPIYFSAGMDFSPSGRYFYVHGYENPYKYLFQFDLFDPVPSNTGFVQTDTLIGQDQPSGIQCGPDGKIYLVSTYQTEIDVIDNPEQAQAPITQNVVNLTQGPQPLFGLVNVMGHSTYDPIPHVIGPTLICPGTQATYDLHFDPCRTNSILWEYGSSGTLISSVDTQAVILAGTPGVDTLIVHKMTDCATLSDTLLVEVIAPTHPNLGADTVICEGDVIVLDPGTGFTSYTWQDNSADSSFTITQAGVYYVETVGPCGERGIDSIVVTPCVGLSGSEWQAGMTIAPNPNRGTFRVEGRFGEWVDQVEMRVIDALGRILLERPVAVHGITFTHYLQMQGAAQGVYILEIRSGGKAIHKTFRIAP